MSDKLEKMLAAPPMASSAYFRQEREKRPQYISLIDEMEDLYIRKLYHQFTNHVESYLVLDGMSGFDVADFLFNIIFALKQKLSPLRTVSLIDMAVSRLSPEDGMLLINRFESAFVDIPDAAIRSDIVKANTLIRCNDLPTASDILLTQLATRLDKEIGVDIGINSAYHQACANYFRASDNPRQFYDSTLLYLAYTPLNSIPSDKQSSTAFELCVSGLIADGMFDFGDLSAMAILATIDDEHKWITKFIEAASEGSLDIFESALRQYEQKANDTFGVRMSQLRLKMTLSSLVDLAFKLPPHDRHISLDVISQHCQVPLAECERLVMKAMGLELIKGSIDGIDNELVVTWVKPRMVDSQRIELIRNRFITWSSNVKQLVSQLEETIPELLV